MAARDRIYLHVKQGIVSEMDFNLSEYSIDEEPLLEVLGGKLNPAGLYDREIQNAYIVAGYGGNDRLSSFVKVPAAEDALKQAQDYQEYMMHTLPAPSRVCIIEVDRDFKDSVAYRMAGKDDIESMIAENTEGAFKEISRFPVTVHRSDDKKQQITNPLNDTIMAKKSTTEAQVQEPEVKQEVNEKQAQQTAGQEQQAKKELREGVHIFQAKDKENKVIPGVYRVMVVKDGVKSDVATLTKEDRDQYFKDVKDKKGQEAEAVRKAVADKYIAPDGKRIEAPKNEEARKFELRHASDENTQRISEVNLFKRNDNGMYAIRCKIDGVQQMSRTFDTANKSPKIADFNKKLLNAYFDGFKDLDKDAQM